MDGADRRRWTDEASLTHFHPPQVRRVHEPDVRRRGPHAEQPCRGYSADRARQRHPGPLESPGSLAKIAGWGNTIKQPLSGNNAGDYPDRMRVARVPIVSDTRARKVYVPVYVGALMIAAGKGEKDTCDGDSGGPIFASTAGKRYQIGITSFGKGCATRTYPGV